MHTARRAVMLYSLEKWFPREAQGQGCLHLLVGNRYLQLTPREGRMRALGTYLRESAARYWLHDRLNE